MIVLENITLYSLFTRNKVDNNDEGEKKKPHQFCLLGRIGKAQRIMKDNDFLTQSSAIALIVCDRRGSVKPGLNTYDCPDRPNPFNQTQDIPDRPNQALPYDRPDCLSTIWSHRDNCMETRLKERIA